MHDPLTVAFTIRYPWVNRRNRKSTDKFLRTYHDSFITIWHKDPEKRGDDDSCDWFGRRIPERYEAQLKDLITNPDDNCAYFFGEDAGEYEATHRLFVIAANVRRIIAPRPWWQHPRFHVWHWQIQCQPLQNFQRWAWSRCATCGKRFSWGYSPVSGSWYGTGPRWFRTERDIYHHDCYGTRVDDSQVAG